MNADSAREVLAQLAADGLISGSDEIELTEKGRALHRSLLDSIAGRAAQLLSQFDRKDLETTVSTMQAIAERAAQEASFRVR